MGDLTDHFSGSEFDCHGNDGCVRLGPSCALLDRLEELRRRRGDHPLRIVSGFRCVPHNDRVGGAFASRHCWGDAADIEPGLLGIDEAHDLGFTGIGISDVWVTHVDMRPGGNALWYY